MELLLGIPLLQTRRETTAAIFLSFSGVVGQGDWTLHIKINKSPNDESCLLGIFLYTIHEWIDTFN